MNQTTQNLKGIILGLLIVIGISYAQAAWQGPTATPPNGNADAPINVSATGQTKAGGLVLNTGGAQNGLVIELGKFIAKGTAELNGGTIKFGSFINCGSLSTDASGNLVCGAGQSPPPPAPPTKEENCASDGGSWQSSQGLCYFSGTSCASGWFQVSQYSSTNSGSCGENVGGNCTTACSTGSHTRINAPKETCTYQTGGSLYDAPLSGCYNIQQSTCSSSIITEVGCDQ